MNLKRHLLLSIYNWLSQFLVSFTNIYITSKILNHILSMCTKRLLDRDFPSGPVVKNPRTNGL